VTTELRVLWEGIAQRRLEWSLLTSFSPVRELASCWQFFGSQSETLGIVTELFRIGVAIKDLVDGTVVVLLLDSFPLLAPSLGLLC